MPIPFSKTLHSPERRERNWKGRLKAMTSRSLPSRASKHPLLARFLMLVLVLTIWLGVIHDFRIGGEVLIVLVRHAKHELAQLGDVAERLKRELTTWNEDP
jgi:hypothetical protein